MNVLLDANVLVAAFAARGRCAEVFETCSLEHNVIVSERILKEVHEALVRKIRVSPSAARAMVRLVRLVSRVVDAPALAKPVCRDPDDDHVLSAALMGESDCVVTGDRDLLDLHEFEDIPILAPAAFWRFEAEQGH